MPREPVISTRIRWLIGTHLVLAAAPLLGSLLEFSMAALPLLWALISLPIGGLMTLSVWVGMGRTRLLFRLALGLAASFYLSIWPFLYESIQNGQRMSGFDRIMAYLEAVGPFSIILFLFGGAFMLIGRRYELTRIEPGAESPRNERLQFSMLQAMLVMSVVAIVLSLLRATRDASEHGERSGSTWEWLVMDAFMFVIFFVNTACAAFAALGPTKVKRNVGLVFLVSIGLGIAVAIAMHNDTISWWLFASSSLIAIIPTATVVVSLLVVRSCGYRLARRSALPS